VGVHSQVASSASVIDNVYDGEAPQALPFPTSVGVLMGISLCAHLAAVVEAFSGAMLAGAVLFLIGQFAFSLGLIRLIDGDWVFQDIRLVFVLFYFLYGCTYPLVSLLLKTSPSGITEAAFLYGTALLGFNLVQWWHKQPWRDVSKKSLSRIRPTFVCALLMFASFAAVIANAYLSGSLTFVAFDRSQLLGLYSQSWVVSMMVVNGFMMFIFAGWPNLSWNAKWIVGVSVAAFVMFHLLLGNRRDFLPMFMFLAGIASTRARARIRLKALVIGSSIFVLFLFMGVIRLFREDPTRILRNPVQLFATQNEFVMPIQTLMYYVKADKPLHYGWTYISAPGLFLPRAIWPEKPRSLSLQFNNDAFGNALVPGYGYTPLTEAFINFSWVGPFIVLCLISLALVKLVKNADVRPGLYFICFSMAVDFHRGDFSGTLYVLVVIPFAYWVMSVVSRITWAPKVVRGTWPAPPTAPVVSAPVRT
jgi:oligosaccharide repeat unit polymerase